MRFGRDDKAGACSACVYLSDRMEKIWKDDKLHLCGKKKYTKRVIPQIREEKKTDEKKKYRPLLG